MLVVQAIILGILQGIAEFLPISSSGHLVIVQSFFPNLAQSPVVLDIVLHMGTLLALLVYFFKDILNIFKNSRLLGQLTLATVLTVIIVFPLKPFVENLFNSPLLASVMLFITALMLFLASKFNGRTDKLTYKHASIIGIAQAFAVIPGISRSGTTISTGLFSGLKSSLATEFSFLLAIPIIFGAGVLELRHVSTINNELIIPYIAGFVVSFVFGLISIKWFISLLKTNGKTLKYFSYYLFIISTVSFIYFIQ